MRQFTHRFHDSPCPTLRAVCALYALLFLLTHHGAVRAEVDQSASALCRLVVLDSESRWPVPQIRLTTTHNVSFVTDNAGVVAFDLPELMGRETWLTVHGHGYERNADGFGNRGVRITPLPGETIEIEIDRISIAKRLGRVTGGGLFAEAQRFGAHLDWKESGILGCDSVQNAVYKGKLFWAWGDTSIPNYPLGIFHMTGATTALQPLDQFEPPLKLKLDYFTDGTGNPRAIADLGGNGPTWLSGFISLQDAAGKERLVAHYAKIEPPLTTYRTGLCEWDTESESFISTRVLWNKADSDEDVSRDWEPSGHPVRWTDNNGKRWALFGDPLPRLKIPDAYETWLDPKQWKRVDAPKTILSADGNRIEIHRGAIARNDFRQRWICLFGQIHGDSSNLGEIWYCEADSPFGPWGPAVKVLTHDQYTFYNPQIHSEMTPADSPILLFEGTYTQLFSDNPERTPRHDYNQVLYRLDLDDPRLAPARN